MKAIYKRELKSYFQSMIGYAFIAFLLAFVGIYFMAYNLNAGYPYFSYALSGVMFMFLVAVPILTMKSFSEERKSKTDQLLLTSPVRLVDVVLGKYLAMVPERPTSAYPGLMDHAGIRISSCRGRKGTHGRRSARSA